MNRHEPFRYRNTEELLKKAEELGINLPFQDSIAPLFSSLSIRGFEIPNRIAVQPMEGCDSSTQGAPDELTFRRYRRYAQGGNGLIWFEACSVSPAGRANPRQLQLTGETLPAFQRLVEITRNAARGRFGPSHNPCLVLQLTHSGRRSMRGDRSKPKAAYFNPLIDKSPGDVDLYRDEELVEVRDQFVAAAILARQAGFDAVDIKACHGYLLHELLSAFSRTDSAYGGEFESRTRLLLEIARQVRETVPQVVLAVRLNATDGIPYPYGFGVEKTGTARPDLSEPLQLQQSLKDAGCALLNITAGISSCNPHIGRPFNRPVRGASHADVHPLASVSSLIQWAAVFQKAHPSLPVAGTGYSWLRRFWPHVGAAVIAQGSASLIGLGRSSLAYPDAPLDLMDRGKLNPEKCCLACSCCSELMMNGQVAGCVIRGPLIYKQAYRNIRKRGRRDEVRHN
jgi:2,4-dienoyl-CoA reductase-like NADH-dependent reductase (Old Yellow Enzyme family)